MPFADEEADAGGNWSEERIEVRRISGARSVRSVADVEGEKSVRIDDRNGAPSFAILSPKIQRARSGEKVVTTFRNSYSSLTLDSSVCDMRSKVNTAFQSRSERKQTRK